MKPLLNQASQQAYVCGLVIVFVTVCALMMLAFTAGVILLILWLTGNL